MQTKHVVWIFDAAYTHFKERLVKLEIEMARHAYMKDTTLPPSIVTKSREERMQECERAYNEYKDLCEFCLNAKNKAVDKSAEEFATMFKHTIS